MEGKHVTRTGSDHFPAGPRSELVQRHGTHHDQLFQGQHHGEPQFSYKDGELDLSFSGNDIAREDTLLGEIVTITLKIAVDVSVRTFTLLVPKIRLRMGDQVSFDTLGIEMINRSGAFVPPPGPTGVLQTYRSHQLQGVAEAVISFSP